MKKTALFSVMMLALFGCKTEIEKDVSLKDLLNSPIKTETAILNVEVASCGSREDSRKESDSLIQLKAKIPQVFLNAVYKECYSKNIQSFASFELPIGIGHLTKEDIAKGLENDITIYSYETRILSIATKPEFAKRIRNFVKDEFINQLDMNILLNVKNDTGEIKKMALYSAYVDGYPMEFANNFNFPKDEVAHIRLSNASADKLWQYEKQTHSVVLSEPLPLNDQ